MRNGVVFVGVLCAACAGSPPPRTPRTTETAGAECAPLAQFATAEQALGECRAAHAVDRGWPARGAFDALVTRLGSHLSSLEPPRAVTADGVQALAEGIWELLDQALPGSGTEASDAHAARTRAEDAAERLLRDREVRVAPGAAIEALDAVTAVGALADPTGGVDPCATESVRVADARARRDACTSAARHE